jgi:LysR family glycine cleavage system transcriptional activator
MAGRKRRLPSLSALRAFEQAGRSENFARAAEALFVTPGAISRQISQLEEELGMTLFTRKGRSVALTPDGLHYHQAISDAFDRMAAATLMVRRRQASSSVLTLSTIPSFASRWLAPRLSRFFDEHPDIALRVTASRRLVDFEQEGIDAALRYGLGDWPNVSAQLLFHEEVFPVCSPALAEGQTPLSHPSDLKHHRLLHGDIKDDWRTWLRAARANDVDPDEGPRFHDDGAMLQAAIDGAGIALGRSALVAADLKGKRLVEPFGLRIPAAYSYWLVTPLGARNPAAEAFQDWIAREAMV